MAHDGFARENVVHFNKAPVHVVQQDSEKDRPDGN